jgi:hypothetical protein
MSTFIHGKDLHLYKNSASLGNQEIGCSTDCQLSVKTSLRETTSYKSANFRKYKPDMNEWSMSTSSIMTVEGYTYLQALQDWAAQTALTCIFSVKAGISGYVLMQGTAYIVDVNMTGTNGSLATFSVTLQGSEGLAITSTVTPPSTSTDVNRYEYVATGGETSLTASVLIGANAVLSVLRGGTDIGHILTAGTPTNDDKKFVSATGTVSWAADHAAIAGEFFVILWK